LDDIDLKPDKPGKPGRPDDGKPSSRGTR
jgi:hypothetical protein